MLFIKSKPEEIIYHINQLETLLLTKEEIDRVNKFIYLNEFIDDKNVNIFLKDEFNESLWIDETKKIVDKCSLKLKRNLILKKHIKECKNFIVYRYLEEKCSTVNIEAFQQIGSWIFNEIDTKRDEKSRWVSQKFLKNFEYSDIPDKLKLIMKDNFLEINLKWLHQNRKLFFSEDIFKDLKKIV